MLTTHLLDRILDRLPGLTIGVLGDVFLDRYLDIDATLTEPSIETGLDAYQVVQVRSYPGAAGTVINNLAALGVGRICVFSVIGADGEGYELREALTRLGKVDLTGLYNGPGRRTPTYTKPMLQQPGQPARELHRLDIKNRMRLPGSLEHRIGEALESAWPTLDALLVLDQVSEANTGVVTDGVRERLTRLGRSEPGRLILADSRERIGLFRDVSVKPNRQECLRAVGHAGAPPANMEPSLLALVAQTHRAVICTLGEAGILLAEPSSAGPRLTAIPAYPVTGPIDIVGAGDSTSAGIAAAVAAGASLAEAAAFGNLVASITIQQIGTTGTASPQQCRARWQVVAQPAAAPAGPPSEPS